MLNIGAAESQEAVAAGQLVAVAFGAGTGMLTLNHTSTDFTLAADIRSGTLLMQNDGVLGATSMLQMAQGTALEMNGHRQTTGSVNIEDDARVNLDGGHLEITQGGSIAGVLTGSGSLALTGDRLTVDGENSTLSAGITVASGATADLKTHRVWVPARWRWPLCAVVTPWLYRNLTVWRARYLMRVKLRMHYRPGA